MKESTVLEQICQMSGIERLAAIDAKCNDASSKAKKAPRNPPPGGAARQPKK